MSEYIRIINVFLAQIIEGLFTVILAAELCEGSWHMEVKKKSERLVDFLLILPVLAIFHLKGLKLIIPAGILLVQYIILKMYFRKNQMYFATIYILLYVFIHSYIAFIWIMHEAEFISALLGAFLFIEAFHGGVAFSILFLKPKEALSDLSSFLFAFSLMWAGFLFAQVLTIWYGNLPYEVRFFTVRLVFPWNFLMYLILFTNFVIPFSVLLFNKMRKNITVTKILSILILSGILIEKFILFIPG